MPLIQVSHYKFNILEPYVEGHVMTKAEAKALNAARVARMRNIIYKRLSRAGGLDEVMDLKSFSEFEKEIEKIDQEFEFDTTASTSSSNWTLQDEVEATARESAEQVLRQSGKSSEFLPELIIAAKKDPRIQREAERRFEQRRAVAAAALAELM